jgi:hypothetical protein
VQSSWTLIAKAGVYINATGLCGILLRVGVKGTIYDPKRNPKVNVGNGYENVVVNVMWIY